jgi:hypothetical protein
MTKSKMILGTLLALSFMRGATLLAETTSDYERGFPLSKLRTWDFKEQTRPARDPLASNTIWSNRIRTALETDLSEKGLERKTSAEPDFLVAYYMGTDRGFDTRIIGYGFPRGFRRWGWGPGWNDVNVWRFPYTESTLVLDVIDAGTNQLVWRGYDTEAINFSKSDKAIQESVDKLVKRFVKESNQES